MLSDSTLRRRKLTAERNLKDAQTEILRLNTIILQKNIRIQSLEAQVGFILELSRGNQELLTTSRKKLMAVDAVLQGKLVVPPEAIR
jgi:hypothetical protein